MDHKLKNPAGPPMTLADMRALDVHGLMIYCLNPRCLHRARLDADAYADDVPVPTFGPRMVCTCCGLVRADARPNWLEQPERQSLTGAQWR
jgi:hypothetical protein